MKPTSKWLTDLKLRASYGVNGTLPSDLYGTVHQKVLSSTGIVLQSEVQTVEEAEIQTDIQVVIRFPFQIPIFNLRLNQCGILHIAATKACQAHIAV